MREVNGKNTLFHKNILSVVDKCPLSPYFGVLYGAFCRRYVVADFVRRKNFLEWSVESEAWSCGCFIHHSSVSELEHRSVNGEIQKYTQQNSEDLTAEIDDQ